MALTTVQLGMQGSPQFYGFKNRIINGAMVISQRNGTSTVATPTDGQYVLDRFATFTNGGGVYSVGQSSTAPTGFTNSMLCTVTTADSSIAATDYYLLTQAIEGFNVGDLGFGTASAKTVTLSFWVRSSVTGTFGFGLRQGSGARSYVAEYTISAANTWEQKTITIAGDTTGTWYTDNQAGMICTWDLGSGSNRNATANTWSAGNYWRASGDTNLIATNGATFYITGVQLEVGVTATDFDYRPYGTELALCQRYFWRMNGKSGGNATFAAGQVYSSTDVRAVLTNPVVMRGDTSVTFTGSNFAYANAGSVKTLSTLNAADQTPQTALLYSGAGTTSATQGQAAFWVITNIDSYISVSAEL